MKKLSEITHQNSRSPHKLIKYDIADIASRMAECDDIVEYKFDSNKISAYMNLSTMSDSARLLITESNTTNIAKARNQTTAYIQKILENGTHAIQYSDMPSRGRYVFRFNENGVAKSNDYIFCYEVDRNISDSEILYSYDITLRIYPLDYYSVDIYIDTTNSSFGDKSLEEAKQIIADHWNIFAPFLIMFREQINTENAKHQKFEPKQTKQKAA